MSTHIPDPDDIGAVRPFASDDDALWGDIPRTDRLSWLRIASHHWPFFPGAAVGGLTARSLAQGRIVHSESLIRVARNAFDAGFTPDEYATLRRLIQGRTPAHLVTGRDHRPQHADDYYEIDAAQWRGWLDLVRAGESGERALAIFLTREQRPGVPLDDTPPGRTGADPRPAASENRFAHGHAPLGSGLNVLSHPDAAGAYRAWWRVLLVFPPVRAPLRTGTGKYVSREDGLAWEEALNGVARAFEAAGFTARDLYVLYLTLDRLTEDQWARVDKRLFEGEGVHTRDGWLLSPIAEKWAAWPRLVHDTGLLPHEATERVLGGVWPRRSAVIL